MQRIEGSLPAWKAMYFFVFADSIDAMRLLVIDMKACWAEASEKHAEENRPGVL
jgi:hypothetical protein